MPNHPQYRALLGIDFDGVADEPGVRVEPGETLPPISHRQVHDLKAAGAIELVPLDERKAD